MAKLKLTMFEKYKMSLNQSKKLHKLQDKDILPNLIKESFELELKDLSFRYSQQSKLVLDKFSATLQNGKVYCILGANGAGKSTLFKLLLNLLSLQRGEISFKSDKLNLDLMSLNIKERAKFISYVPQEEANSFMYKAEDVVLMSSFARHGSAFFSPDEADEAKVETLMMKLGIGHLIGKFYPLLSGGERQLVRIARALFQECPILLMDEPTTGLDYGFQMKILSWARALARQGYLVIFTSHNPQLASVFSDEILLLDEGAIMETELVLNKENLAKIYSYDFEFYPIVDDELVEKLANAIKNEGGKKPSRFLATEADSYGVESECAKFELWLKEWFSANCDYKYASILPKLEDLKDMKINNVEGERR